MRITLLKTVTISSCNLFRSLQSAAKGTAGGDGGAGGAGEEKQLRKAEMNSLAGDSHLLTAPSFLLPSSSLSHSSTYHFVLLALYLINHFGPKLPIDIVKRANEPIRPRPD